MSRRSRKRQGRRGGGWLLKSLVGLLLLAIVAVVIGHVALQAYLRSDDFRVFVSRKVSEGLKVEGEFSTFRWDGFAVGVDDYQAVGEQTVRKLSVEDVHTEVALSGFWRGVWEVKEFRVRRVELELGDGGSDDTDTSDVVVDVEVEEPAGEQRKWLPREVEISRIDIGNLKMVYPLDEGRIIVDGVTLAGRTTPGGGYDILLSGGTLTTPHDKLPVLRIDMADLRYRDRAVFLNEAKAYFWENGFIDMSGEFDSSRRMHAVQGTIGGVGCDEVLEGDWKQRVSGELATDFKVVSHGDRMSADGRMVLKRGVITALPLLDALSVYADTRRFRVLNLSEAHTDWHWQEDHWRLNNLVLASEGLLRLEGNLTVRGRELDGRFMLGIAPGTLARIPGAESKVFVPGERGLLWAPLNITGTLDNPQQDLKQRLVAAAGERILSLLPEEGIKILNDSGKGIGETQEKVIREVGGLLNSLFGSGDR